MQKFYKGRTNNHLTWVMVDATDFATPESALSAATTIKIYGKLRGGTGTNLVSSGTGSLTNDITHVGASALGIYTIALAKADLSDASAAWYDQYIIALSGTGAARQVLVVDGGIDDSNLSAIVSDLTSALLVTQSMASDAASAATQANSRVLLVQSRISDAQSFLSDMHSDLISLITTTGVQLNASMLSDIRSAIAAGPAATVTASDISDIASAVWAHTVGTRVDSRILVIQSTTSDTRSGVSDMHSDLLSLLGTTGILLNASTMSDLRSAIAAGPAATVTASDISDIASAVRAILVSDLSDILSAAQQTNSRVLINQSRISDVYSQLSDFRSDLFSQLATASDVASAVWAHAVGTRVDSRILVVQSQTSDVYSQLSDFRSDLNSLVTTTGVQLNASTLSDLRSAIAAGPAATITASDISDIASAVRAILVSDLSDILSAAQQTNSRVLLNQSRISDTYSLLSDLQSDFQSRVPKAVATQSQLSDVHSDLASYMVGLSAQDSNIYSLLSDLHSDVGVLSGIVSDAYSNLVAGVTVGASSLSDIASVIQAAATTTPIPANIKMINDVSLTGDGTLGNEWGP